MKNLILLLLIVVCAFSASAQMNLVKNPSFEQDTACPNNNEQVSYSNYWTGIDSSWVFPTPPLPLCNPAYFNTCTTVWGMTIPNNSYFYHYPRTGNGMMGVTMYSDGADGPLVNMYLQGRLYATLVAGQSYCVTFYVVRATYCGYANNNIGAYLDNGSIDTASVCHNAQTEYTPQILETTVITDTLNWTKIQGSFVANGTERFITIGNFFDTAHTEHIYYGSDAHGYYLVDDVSIIASNATAYAGPDKYISRGDTTSIGVDSNGTGMPCYWYILGSTTPIDSGGTIKVAPLDTTTYIVAMELCGTITYDTVTVFDTGCAGPPTVTFSYLANPTYGGTDTISFSLTATGGIDSAVWSFGDGLTDTGYNPTHGYTVPPDSFDVCLMAYGPCGADTVCQWVHTEACPASIPSFTYTVVGNTATISYNGTAYYLDSISWSLGDGAIVEGGSSGSFSHTYSVAGTYTVCVRLFTLCGNDTFCNTITILPCTGPPTASFTDTGTTTIGFTYTGTTTGVDSVQWSFGDGGTSNLTNPIHSYSSAGTYTVCVTVYTGCGNDTVCGIVVVSTTEASPQPSPGERGLSVYPNPAGDAFNISGVAGNMSYRLLNVTGECVQQGNLRQGNNKVSVQDILPGVYILELTGEDGERQMVRLLRASQ